MEQVFYHKHWEYGDQYDFVDELNRIESYNKYIQDWLKMYYDFDVSMNSHKTDWNYKDVIDIKNINRIKSNINTLLELFESEESVKIDESINQIYDNISANEIEEALSYNLNTIGDIQFQYKVTGLSICGNDLLYGG